ncbi:hypothetical protein [Asticcacaulis sp. AC402]|uniref:hypothetical protein n=1 Tax=Asticcacaulis sp. AC402 TaxID=1282361 RepID=UPI0003C3D01C|nr:hypothetical protein [Asticcacaulis sp. AC402]ESQ74593.1 hypothetical protein ABAC402_13190 [Asticcacaulis sp. AC402]
MTFFGRLVSAFFIVFALGCAQAVFAQSPGHVSQGLNYTATFGLPTDQSQYKVDNPVYLSTYSDGSTTATPYSYDPTSPTGFTLDIGDLNDEQAGEDAANGFAPNGIGEGNLTLKFDCPSNLTEFTFYNNIVKNGGLGVSSFVLHF